MPLITNLNIDEFNKRFVDEVYPCIVIRKPSEPLVVAIRNLIKGTIPINIEFNGQMKKVAEMDCSAYNAMVLLETIDSFEYVDENKQAHTIRKVQDYLEVFI